MRGSLPKRPACFSPLSSWFSGLPAGAGNPDLTDSFLFKKSGTAASGQCAMKGYAERRASVRKCWLLWIMDSRDDCALETCAPTTVWRCRWEIATQSGTKLPGSSRPRWYHMTSRYQQHVTNGKVVTARPRSCRSNVSPMHL